MDKEKSIEKILEQENVKKVVLFLLDNVDENDDESLLHQILSDERLESFKEEIAQDLESGEWEKYEYTPEESKTFSEMFGIEVEIEEE